MKLLGLFFVSPPSVRQVSRMLEEHEWIHSERQFFGQPNTSYDFKTNNPREAGQRLKKLEETTTKLERNVNKRAMNMLNEAEERVRSLIWKGGAGRGGAGRRSRKSHLYLCVCHCCSITT